MKELLSAETDRAVERAAISKQWVIAQLKENVERAMQARPVLDKKGNPTHEYVYDAWSQTGL